MVLRKEEMMNNKALDDVIKEGLRLLDKTNLTLGMVKVWASYSMDIINIISTNNYIKYQYSAKVNDALFGMESPHNRLKECLKFLIANYSSF